MASKRNGALYTSVASNLPQRVHQHRESMLFCEFDERMGDANAREKQIKSGSRAKKMTLIEARNPQWRDLYEDLA